MFLIIMDNNICRCFLPAVSKPFDIFNRMCCVAIDLFHCVYVLLNDLVDQISFINQSLIRL